MFAAYSSPRSGSSYSILPAGTRFRSAMSFRSGHHATETVKNDAMAYNVERRRAADEQRS